MHVDELSGSLWQGIRQSTSNEMIKHRNGRSSYVSGGLPAGTATRRPAPPSRSSTAPNPPPRLSDPPFEVVTSLYIANLHCPSCVVTIEHVLHALHPVPTAVSTSIISHSVTVTHSSLLRSRDLASALEAEGFDVHSVFQQTPRGPEEVQPIWSTRGADDDWENSFTEAVARWSRSFLESRGSRSSRLGHWDGSHPAGSLYGRDARLDIMKKEKKHSENCAECRQEQGLEKLASKPIDAVPLRQLDGVSEHQRVLAGQRSFDNYPYRPSTDFHLPSGDPSRASAFEKSGFSVAVDRTTETGAYRADIGIVGMTCAACVGCITNAVEELPFVRSINVSLLTHSATVIFEGKDHAEQVRSTIEDAGFDATIEGLEAIGTPAKKRRTLILEGGGDIWKATYMIGGMTCAACVGNITTVLKQLDFVQQIDINLIQNSGVIVFKGKDNVNTVTETIEDAGFEATLENIVNAMEVEEEKIERTVSFRVDGMYCHHCPTHIADGIEQEFKSRVLIEKIGTTADPIFRVKYIPHAPEFTIRSIFDLVASINPAFRPSPYHPPTLEDRSRALQAKERRNILLRLALCVAVGIPAFIIGIVCMTLLHRDDALRTFMMAPMWAGNVSRAEWALLILATPVYFFGADVFHRKAYKEVKAMWRPGSKTPVWKRFVRFGSMNMLMCLGTTIAYFSSIAELILNALEKDAKRPAGMRRSMFALFKRQEGHSHPTAPDAVEVPIQTDPAPAPAPNTPDVQPNPAAQPPAANTPAPQPVDPLPTGGDMVWTTIGLQTAGDAGNQAPTIALGVGDLPGASSSVAFTDPNPFTATPTVPAAHETPSHESGVHETLATLTSAMHSAHTLLPTTVHPGMDMGGNVTTVHVSGGGEEPHSMGGSAVYFDSVIFLTMFLLVGRFLEAYSKAKTGDAVTNLGKLRPTEAILVEETNVLGRNMPVVLLDTGDVVRVQAGGSPPFDGIIIDGSSRFDESSLTGESRLVPKEIGDTVYSGTVNRSGPVSVKITTTEGSSMLDQIIRVVREGQTHRAPVERVADIITSHFVPFVILVAIITWVVWLTTGVLGVLPDDYMDSTKGGYPLWSLRFAIAVFVIACPCGIGLAAPTAMFVGGGLAAKFGILVKGGGEAFQEASDLDVVVFDKTGTLTQGGDPKVTGFEMTSDDDSDEVLAMVRKVESGSGHVVAKAVVDFCEEKLGLKKPEKKGKDGSMQEKDIADSKPVGKAAALEDMEVKESEEISGMGMKASFALPLAGLTSGVPQKSGATLDVDVLVGNERLLQAHNVTIDQRSQGILQGWKQQGKSVVLVALRAAHSGPDDLKTKMEASPSSQALPDSAPSAPRGRARSHTTSFTSEANYSFPLRPPRPLYMDEAPRSSEYSMSDYGDEVPGNMPGNRSGSFYSNYPPQDQASNRYMSQHVNYWENADPYTFPLPPPPPPPPPVPPMSTARTDRYNRQSTRSSIYSMVGTGTYTLTCLFAISDPLREEAVDIVSALQKRHIDVWMLSGDNPTTAQAVALQVGIPPSNVIAGVLPEEKAAKIKWLQQTVPARKKGKKKHRSQRKRQGDEGQAEEDYFPPGRATVAMVGDGINDSPALTMADVGIAIGSGSDIAISSADFILIHSKLSSVLTLIDLSRKVFRRVWFNFGWACVYNVIAMPVAAGVLYPLKTNGAHIRLDPVWAALAMACSSISVVCSSLALKTRLPGLGFRQKQFETGA